MQKIEHNIEQRMHQALIVNNVVIRVTSAEGDLRRAVQTFWQACCRSTTRAKANIPGHLLWHILLRHANQLPHSAP